MFLIWLDAEVMKQNLEFYLTLPDVDKEKVRNLEEQVGFQCTLNASLLVSILNNRSTYSSLSFCLIFSFSLCTALQVNSQKPRMTGYWVGMLHVRYGFSRLFRQTLYLRYFSIDSKTSLIYTKKCTLQKT